MEIKKPSITISGIAQAAGVSTATVSRVINEKGMVAKEIRFKVQQAIDELGYQPQRVHKKNDQRNWVAVLTDHTINAFYPQILAAIQEQALEYGFTAFVMQMPENPDRRAEVFKQLKQQSWAGVLSAGFYMAPEAWVAFQEEIQSPLVLMNTLVEHSNIASLKVNFKGAISNAIQHLLDLGHTRIAYFGDLTNEFSEVEFHGVEAALSRYGYAYPEEYRFSVSHTPEGASQAVSRIMMLPPEIRPTAILAFDDEFAIHILNALRYYQLRIPEDISLIGFDNIPMASHTYPPLTTIDVPRYRIGKQLVELLLQLIESNRNDFLGHMIIDGSLVVRGSTGPVSGRG